MINPWPIVEIVVAGCACALALLSTGVIAIHLLNMISNALEDLLGGKKNVVPHKD
jgi:hypothetical protein